MMIDQKDGIINSLRGKDEQILNLTRELNQVKDSLRSRNFEYDNLSA